VVALLSFHMLDGWLWRVAPATAGAADNLGGGCPQADKSMIKTAPIRAIFVFMASSPLE